MIKFPPEREGMGVSRAFEKRSRHVVNIAGGRSKAGNIQELPWALVLGPAKPCAQAALCRGPTTQHSTQGVSEKRNGDPERSHSFPKATALF